MFKFKLEPVLKFRKIKEEEVIKEFQAKKKEILDTEQKIKNLETNLNETKIQKKEKININDLKLIDNYIRGLTNNINEAKEKLLRLQYELKEIEEKLHQARKERKILENLKEKKYLEYIKEENLKEQKFLDEIASIAENRKMSK